ncbi:peptidoglycan/xylan/chitin deacetylase (PgdA/CDA1 family) [Roseiarcus fermentans]|uniref:Chitooligosaccharide deacetylase n=1 Tax=Roseiarcus fermentans TaxID=1473586 RepID=A0A366FQ95_9HYPH|nr:polysaccharide deacetylase family protein [Roseiarcus fermentans]RBP16210.1 peptidoglycan/xylan/chitin deacetylase (PgdA/CDA1 family) [Roseiarcus fermentans]
MRIAGALTALILAANCAAAAECGPDRLGVERIVKVGTQGGLEVGLKTYRQTIPLGDHEVILTFDDGPDAASTPKILDALAAECVKATFFEIGRNAEALPGLARREVLDGHTVAFHTWSHPQPTLRYLPGGDAAARQDILRGMIAVEKAAYGRDVAGAEPRDLAPEAPFFRYPGFADTPELNAWLAANDVGVFGVDLWASDWIKMTPDEELKLVMGRLARTHHKGMLLLHDNHPWTAAMVPMLLARLKAEGYRIVHMTGGGAGSGPTEPAPPGWTSETERVVGALKPRLERAAGKPVASGPIPVKPAPTDNGL